VHAPHQSTPGRFESVVDAVVGMSWRREMVVEEIPAPSKIAPQAFALSAEVVVGETELGNGRLVLLHDPSGNISWDGDFRCVTYARAEIDTEMVHDPLLTDVGWSWLLDALERNHARYVAPSGTVTAVASKSFGAMESEPPHSEIELRASWTPELAEPAEIIGHFQAWSELLCLAAGLPPLPEGVVSIAQGRNAGRAR